MQRSEKQREPVAFKSLAELKRFIRPGVEFKTRQPRQSRGSGGADSCGDHGADGMTSIPRIKDQPNSRFSTDNGGKGFRTDFAKADAYIFDGTTVKVKDARKQDRGVIYELNSTTERKALEETNMDRKMVNFIKEQYPPGTRIRLNSMEDPYAPIAPGTEGE